MLIARYIAILSGRFNGHHANNLELAIKNSDTMNSLVNTLLLFDRLNDRQIKLIDGITQKIHLRKDEYFAEPGHIYAQLAYVDIGVLRYNYYNRNAENITSSLIGEGNFVAGIGTLHFPVIQTEYLQAITECNLLVIGKSGMEELAATIANWDNILKRVTQKAIRERRRRIIDSMEATFPELAAEQYLEKFTDLSKYLTGSQILPYFQTYGNDHISK
jgi:CRP-like cAMP-binding protein